MRVIDVVQANVVRGKVPKSLRVFTPHFEAAFEGLGFNPARNLRVQMVIEARGRGTAVDWSLCSAFGRSSAQGKC
jgi:hypothetical protein